MTAIAARRAAPATIESRLAALDQDRLLAALDRDGYGIIPSLLAREECQALTASYADAGLFRSRVVMARHGFGQGEYKYFADPLPAMVAALRRDLYPMLAGLANRWNAVLGESGRFPATHEAYRERCHRAGQTKPTPLLLKYGAGDYNRLHQDLYGDEVFPIQATVLLSAPGEDFTGGEFILVEQRPRQQSRAEVVPLSQGDAVIFAVHHRPQRGTRGFFRVTMRHGVSRVRSGNRMTLGIIFHDAA